MRHIHAVIATAAFTTAAGLSWLTATGAATLVENRTESGVSGALEAAGHDWVEIEADGLRITLSGSAGSEAERFQALSIAGDTVDAARVIDAMEVTDPDGLEPPRFSIELLRNAEGVSLIGLIPAEYDREVLLGRMDRLTGNGGVADMLETADHPIPEGWESAVSFGLDALETLPRSRVSIASDRVAITALADDREDRQELERRLRRDSPRAIQLSLDIAAPRPVITPFTLRFIMDDEGARFDACAADTEEAQARILAAAIEAGAPDHARCTVGIGSPSASWGAAGETVIGALGELGAGRVTISDTDVSFLAAASVAQEDYQRVMGELEADLPDVFSLSARREEPETDDDDSDRVRHEFRAVLSQEGEIELRGHLTDASLRGVAESYARSRFGSGAVYNAVRLEPELPGGWSLRVLTGLEALAELHEGEVRVTPEQIVLEGVTANPDSSGVIARLFGEKLGRDAEFSIDVDHDASLMPAGADPTPDSCLAAIDEILGERQIGFESGASELSERGEETLDEVAAVMRDCGRLALEVGGHTDSQGPAETNQQLSQARAETVISALMDRRVLVSELTARGYGESRPIADNSTASGRAANRRIEFRSQDELQPRERDPELEATIQFESRVPDDETVRPSPRPGDS